MKIAQKEMIEKLRQNGNSYSSIADTMHISINTIKSYCKRNNINPANIIDNRNTVVPRCCPQCSNEVIHKPKCKPRRFCSDTCRVSWWNTHQNQVDRKAVYILKCINCGNLFESYGNKNRRYCQHSCYIDDRFNKP